MFHIFHKSLLDLANKASDAIKKGDYSLGFTLSERLSGQLLDLDTICKHENFTNIVKKLVQSGKNWTRQS